LLKTSPAPDGVKVTFVLPLDVAPEATSVLGDFNGWDPFAHPLRKRSNGTRSVSVTVPAGERFHFKYLTAEGAWFCDPDVEQRHNEWGEADGILET
jgi:1,4-alpha-glucan branching enzyme